MRVVGSPRVLAVALACLLVGRVAASQDLPDRSAAAYRSARVVAVLPPGVVVREEAAGGAVREDWSETAYGNVAAALQAALEERGFEVRWIPRTPQAAAFIDDLVESMTGSAAVMGSGEGYKGSAANLRYLEHERKFRQSVLGLLLPRVGADLLVAANAEGLVQPAKRRGGDVVGKILGALLFGITPAEEPSTECWVTVLVAESDGSLIYAGRGSTGQVLMEEEATAAVLRQALEGLPRPTRDKPFGAKCILSAECQPGLYCPYGRCLRGEDPPPRR